MQFQMNTADTSRRLLAMNYDQQLNSTLVFTSLLPKLRLCILIPHLPHLALKPSETENGQSTLPLRTCLCVGPSADFFPFQVYVWLLATAVLLHTCILNIL